MSPCGRLVVKREIIRGTFIMVDTWGQTAVHHVLCALQVDRRRATTHTTKHWNAEMPATYGLKKKMCLTDVVLTCFPMQHFFQILPLGLAGLCDGMRAILSFVLSGGRGSIEGCKTPLTKQQGTMLVHLVSETPVCT